MSYLLGIDVGTTRTAAAICRPRAGEVEIVNLGDRASAVPSVLFLGADGSVLVGDAAERRAVSDPDRVVREFKRRIGDSTPLNIGGRAWPAQDLAAQLVRWVVDRVAEREGGSPDQVAVTHPASWGAHKKDLFAAALAGQGMTVTFLAEPQAAALHYASAERIESGSTIAVYDLGGGTFDAAVVHKDSAAGFSLAGRPEGLERLGGMDFDQAVFDHVRAGLPGMFDALDDSDASVLAAVARVRRDCTEAKEALSSDTDVSIPVLLPESRGSVRLHRSEFEGLIREQVEDTVAALRRAITSAGLTPEQLSTVLLVGGSSRIPLVAQLVSEQLGRPVAVDADPKNAIAKGAALALTPSGISATGAQPARPPAPQPWSGAAAGAGAGGSGPNGGQSGPAHNAGAGPVGSGGMGPAGGRGPVGAVGSGAIGPGAGAVGAGAVGAVGFGVAERPTPPGRLPQQSYAAGGPVGVPRPTINQYQQPRLDGGYPRPDGRDARPSGARSPAMLIIAGGLLTAAAIVAALFLLPGRPSGNADNRAPLAPAVVVPPSQSSPPTTAAPRPPATAARPKPTAVRPVPPPRTTTPPPTTTSTTVETSTTTAPTSTTPSQTPSSAPPPEPPVPPEQQQPPPQG